MKNKAIGILLTLTLLKGIIWMLITPPLQVPDENIHFGMIQYLAEIGHHPGPRNPEITSKELARAAEIVRFNWMQSHPVWQGLEADFKVKLLNLDLNLKQQFISIQNGQKLPQLYFWASVPVYRLLNSQSFFIRFYSLRLFSVILSCLSVYLTYLISRQIFKSKFISLAPVALVALQPMNSFISSAISYDVAAILASTLFLFFGLKFIKTKHKRDLILCLIVILLGPFIKTQLIALGLCLPFIFKSKYRRLLLAFGIIFLILLYFVNHLPLPDWLYYSANFKDYLDIIKHFFSWLTSGQAFNQLLNYLTFNARIIYAELFPWYWGVFGWLEKIMPLTVYRILKITSAVSFIGLIKYLYTQYKHQSKTIQFRLIKFLITFSLILAAVIFVNDFFIFTKTNLRFGLQGRYFLPSITAHMILLVFGFTQLIPKKQLARLTIFIILAGFCLNLVGLFTLYQFFGNIWA